ncbi:hypothetical protein ETB97_009476 [Aspergillus alliaceus]|uniref:LysM domain-containing protein n=1 Tax=Petromyces alliaceus TaxID=209559 RepID=A0A8H5ZRY9_PETAA|nr:hypothetical protein ETB97_009476 [Aspergillus burnettii]
MLAKTVPTAWKEGHDLSWQGSDYIRWDPEVCYYEYEEDKPAECLDPDFSTTQMTKDMMDVTKLYEKDLLCSECFIKMWRQRLMSALLPSGEHTDYLLNQYSAIQEYCSTKLPVTTYKTTLFASTRTMPVTATGTPVPSPTSCPGQLIEPSDSWMSCRDISDKYNVSTGTVIDATQDQECRFDFPLCLPKPCDIDTIWGKTTCEELAARYSSDKAPISETQFLSWNPNILGACSWVHNSQRVCKGPPGGFFKASGVIHAPTTAGSYYTTAIPAEPTRPGTIPDCGRYYKVVAGDECNTVALRFGITFAEFQTMNSYVSFTHVRIKEDIVATPQSTVVQETASLERVMQEAILLPKMELAVLIGNTRRVLIQDSAHAVLSMVIVGVDQSFADLVYVSREIVMMIMVVRVLMVNAGPALPGTRHALALNLVNVVQYLDIAEVQRSIVVEIPVILVIVLSCEYIQSTAVVYKDFTLRMRSD